MFIRVDPWLILLRFPMPGRLELKPDSMPGFSSNPLFTRASRRIRESAKQAFQRSDFGRVLREFEVANQKPAAGPRDLGRVIRAYQRGGSRRLIEELASCDAGRLARDLERYARSSKLGKKVVGQVLDALGPAGQILKALSEVSGPGGKPSSRERSLAAATKVLKAFGREVLDLDKPEEALETIRVALNELEARGHAIPADLARATTLDAMPTSEPELPAPDRSTVDIPLGDGSTRRFKRDHPIVTGKFVSCTSSNVHSYAYEYTSWTLYVRFLGGEGEHRHGPGPLYQYSHVRPALFLTLLNAGSKGDWVWDHLRIRGTVSGHQHDYRLVGISGGYVPRKATYTPAGEWFIPRRVRTDKGHYLTSSRPSAPARGVPNRGRPKPPNRGTP